LYFKAVTLSECALINKFRFLKGKLVKLLRGSILILNINELEITEGEWVKWMDSVWDINLVNKNLIKHFRSNHPAVFTPELVYRLLKLFSQPSNIVLDPFTGTGTTLCVAAKLKRIAYGIEINPDYYNVALDNLVLNDIPSSQAKVFLGDARNLSIFNSNSIDCIVTSPPYYNSIRYSTISRDISNFEDYKGYLKDIERVISEMKRVLKPRSKLAIIIGDAQEKRRFIPVHSDFINIGSDLGLMLTHVLINRIPDDSRRRKSNKLYGYPNAFFPEFNHEYTIVFEKVF